MPRHDASRTVDRVFRPLKTSSLVVDLVIAGVFAAMMMPLELGLGRMVDHNALSTAVVTLLMAGALAVRRLSPGLALGLAWAGAIAQMAFGRAPSPVDLAIFAVLFAAAAYGSRLVLWLGFASALVGGLVITLYLFAGPFAADAVNVSVITTAVAVMIASTFALGLSWTIGALVRTARRSRANRDARERAEAEATAEQERVRIARDMHDIVAHSLAVVIAQADGARYAVAAGAGAAPGASASGGTLPGAADREAADPGSADRGGSAPGASAPSVADAALATISATARAALSDVRLLLTQLRQPPSLRPASSSTGESWPGQGDRPQPMLADLEQLYAQVRAAGVELRVEVDPAPTFEPPAAAQLAVYRILQEALTNALRHGAGPVDVRLSWHPGRLDLWVRNPLRADGAPPESGHGLIGMTERASLAGGRLYAAAREGSFIVSATLPIGGAA